MKEDFKIIRNDKDFLPRLYEIYEENVGILEVLSKDYSNIEKCMEMFHFMEMLDYFISELYFQVLVLDKATLDVFGDRLMIANAENKLERLKEVCMKYSRLKERIRFIYASAGFRLSKGDTVKLEYDV